MKRRITSLLLLAVLLVAQALPAGAGGMICSMHPRVPCAQRAPCNVAPSLEQDPALAAGTCCRFEQAPDTSPLPSLTHSPEPTRNRPGSELVLWNTASASERIMASSIALASRFSHREASASPDRPTVLRL